jgi:hypothetical protein
MKPGLAWALSLGSFALPCTPMLFCAAPAHAQDAKQDEELQLVEVRVISAQPHATIIDRGSADGLAEHDRIVLRTKEGKRYEGKIVQISERSATVELDDAAIVPAAGTRGEVRVPRSRFATPPPPVAPVTQTGQQPVPAPPPEMPPWERTADGWTADQPLLARVRPLRPKERDPRITGRVYSLNDYINSTDGNRQTAFLRLGTDILYENAFGRGGDFNFAGEVNYRKSEVPDDDDDDGTLARLDRFSYTWGGHRFAPSRYQVGRFLQYEMPEFGILDGVEWDQRMASGNVFGASLGYLPDPDEEMDSFRDLSFATWYRWVADESELFSMTGGYQHTLHDMNADRDLFVAKVLYLPADAWTFSSTVWMDLYTTTDTAKGSGLEVTQAYVTTSRFWESGSTLRATYTHMAFPEVDRNEVQPPVNDQQLADSHNDRVSVYGRQALNRTVGIFGEGGVWKDQVEEGGNAQAGFDVDDMFFHGSHIEVAGLFSNARFSNTLGWRASIAAIENYTAWRLGYEFTLNNIDGFQDNNDDIPQHRARLSWERHGPTGWSLSTYVEGSFYDTETAVLAGILLQRSF